MDIPVNSPDTFGDAAAVDIDGMTVLNIFEDKPPAKVGKPVPAVSRLFSGDGANIIVFTFLPGDCLRDHKAAHPITVQCLQGELDFRCGGRVIRMQPGQVLHLRDHVTHRVDCPDTAQGEAVLLLTMLTGKTAPVKD